MTAAESPKPPCSACRHPHNEHHFGRGARQSCTCSLFRWGNGRTKKPARVARCPRCTRPMLILRGEGIRRRCASCLEAADVV